MPKALGFFVPTYGSPGNSFSQKIADHLKTLFKSEYGDLKKPNLALEQFLSGDTQALADYRVLLAADDQSKRPYLHRFSESRVGQPIEHFNFDGRNFSRSSLNYLLGLALLKKHLEPHESLRTILEIGGGFGTLGEILASSGVSDQRYIDIDIPPTSFVAEYYLRGVLGTKNVIGYSETKDKAAIEIEELPQASVLCSWQIEKLQGSVDLFVNFISFQEMEPHIVENYLNQVTRLGARWVLLRNMREGKQVQKAHAVGVKTPIKTDDYLAMLPKYRLVEKNIFPFGYKTVDGFHSELLLLKRAA